MPVAPSARGALLRAWAFACAELPLRTTFATPFGAGGEEPRAAFAVFAAAGAALPAAAALARGHHHKARSSRAGNGLMRKTLSSRKYLALNLYCAPLIGEAIA